MIKLSNNTLHECLLNLVVYYVIERFLYKQIDMVSNPHLLKIHMYSDRCRTRWSNTISKFKYLFKTDKVKCDIEKFSHILFKTSHICCLLKTQIWRAFQHFSLQLLEPIEASLCNKNWIFLCFSCIFNEAIPCDFLFPAKFCLSHSKQIFWITIDRVKF